MKNEDLSFMHVFVEAMTPTHTTYMFVSFFAVMLCFCCCLARRSLWNELPIPLTKARQQGQSKKSDDVVRGFGKWEANAALAASTGSRMDSKIRSAAASGNYNVIKEWVSKVEKDMTSLDIGDANDRTVLHLAAKR